VEFFINGSSVGSASINGSGLAIKTVTITLAPAGYPVIATFTSTNPNFANSPTASPVTLTVNKEDARATYTGTLFAWTKSTTDGSATITLSATIQDITAVDPSASAPYPDNYPGDITKATVTFVNRDTIPATVIAANVPIGLVNAGDTKTGTATYNWAVNIGSAADSAQYTIGIIVNNYYTRDSSFDDGVVTVSKPLGAGFITGGGYLIVQSSAGLYPGEPGTKNNFGFNVKNGSNGPKGNINTIIRNNGRTYQIKGNAMTSLATQAPTPPATLPWMATFNGKANIQDITNPLLPISIDGNATLQVTMTDKGEPGGSDTIAITVWNKSGGVWFSSNWNGVKTVEQVLGGGNLVVH